jgi:hypothetical protein
MTITIQFKSMVNNEEKLNRGYENRQTGLLIKREEYES